MRLSEKINRLREKRGVSVRELARQLGDVSDSTVGRWMSGASEPSFSEGLRLANFFGVSLDSLADDSIDEPEPREIPDDERALLDQYRALRSMGMIDKEKALAGLAVAVNLRPLAPGEVPFAVSSKRPARKEVS